MFRTWTENHSGKSAKNIDDLGLDVAKANKQSRLNKTTQTTQTTNYMIFFLDRDGTINVDYNFVHKKEEWTFCDGAPEAIRLLNEAGYKVVVVTNQTGIMRRHFTLAQVQGLHRWVDQELQRHGAHIDAWYIAPWRKNLHDGLPPSLLHDRKPGTGMFERAALRFGNPSATSLPVSKSPSIQSPFESNAISVFETVRLTKNDIPVLSPIPPAGESYPHLHDANASQLGNPSIDADGLTLRLHVANIVQQQHKPLFVRSAMAGDKQSDLEPALTLGMRPYLIRSVHFDAVDKEWIRTNDIPVFDRLLDAVHHELNLPKKSE